MAKFDAKTFNPEAFGGYVDLIPKTKRTELLKSRALRGNEQIRNAFTGQTGVVYATIPMYGRLDGDPLNYDGQTDITATSTTTFDRSVVVTGRAKAWVERDFSEDVTGGAGFMDNVARQVADFWDDVDQDTLLAVLDGVFSMSGNTGNTGFVNSHTYDVDTVVDAVTLNNAVQQASGDNKNIFNMIIMHSQVATTLENLRVLEYLKYTDENGIERQLQIATWNGRSVLIDDSMPIEEVNVGTEEEPVLETKYVSYVLGEGAFDFEDIGAEVPFEMDRDPKVNGGQDTLFSRQRKVFAPYGISFTKKAMVSNSPTKAELENGTNWELVHNGAAGGSRKYIDHKAIPIVRMKTLA